MSMPRLFALIAVFLIPLAGLAMIGKPETPRMVTAVQGTAAEQSARALVPSAIARTSMR